MCYCGSVLSNIYDVCLMCEEQGLEAGDWEFRPGALGGSWGRLLSETRVGPQLQGGLSPAGRAEVTSTLDFPQALRDKLAQDVEQAMSCVADTPSGGCPQVLE